MKKGLFITFEGADGSGKTTQLNLVKSFLEQQNYDVVVTREPGALEFGRKIREILLHGKEVICDNAEMFLFLADRAQHIESLIKPSISAGKIVLCDRHVDSTIAYQGYGRGQNIELLKSLNKIAVNSIVPDLTLLFDVSTEISFQRLGNEKDRMESAGIGFHKKVAEGYLQLQKSEPERIKLINANNSIETVYNDTKRVILNLLQERQGE
ncbi:MAG: dTMP kinase [Candidatus Gastranaerophilales bacterium]|nr:dTMP kinase [Candidatus Gastranaerophilales bacterium]